MNAAAVRGLCAVLGLFIPHEVLRHAQHGHIEACLTRPERAVHVEVARFVKAVVLLKDDFYHRHITKHAASILAGVNVALLFRFQGSSLRVTV